MDLDAIVTWLLREAPAVSDFARVVEEVADRLDLAGIRVDRIWDGHMTLHPLMLGRTVTWQRGEPLEVQRIPNGPLPDAPDGSPLARIGAGETAVRQRLTGVDTPLDPRSAELAARGYTDYWIGRGPETRPLDAARLELIDDPAYRAGQSPRARASSLAAWATRQAGGWTDEQVDGIRRVHAAFTVVSALAQQHQVGSDLLTAYLGRDAARRVLAGQVRRGEVRSTEAAILFTDLRGFTALSEALSPELLIALLNDAFDAQIGAIEANRGSVLQIVGDGLLAIFESEEGPGSACAHALAAVAEIESRLRSTNERRAAEGRVPIGWGAGLHYGAVDHGNFGSVSRLAFTVNGPAVNTAARLESIGARLGIRPALSDTFASLCGAPTEPRGEHEAKGLSDPIRIHALA